MWWKPNRKHRRLNRASLATVILLFGIALPGCPPGAGFLSTGSWPWREPCVLPPNANVEELVDHLNARIDRLSSWRSTDVSIKVGGTMAIPLRLKAMITAERPQNFRLTVKNFGMEEADFGSNQDRFWFWIKRGDPYVLTARHDQIEGIGRPLPFEPSWLMEALGVVPIDASSVHLEPIEGESRLVNLIEERTSPSGQPVRRIMRVDTCRGHIVAHELRDHDNRVIARARLGDYKVERRGGVEMPHRIELEWPQAGGRGMSLTMTIGEIDVNPEFIPLSVWQMPKRRRYPAYNLAQHHPRRYTPQQRVSENRLPRRRLQYPTGQNWGPLGTNEPDEIRPVGDVRFDDVRLDQTGDSVELLPELDEMPGVSQIDGRRSPPQTDRRKKQPRRRWFSWLWPFR